MNTGMRQQDQRGALLLEALVAILICAFGLLGFVGMQARSTTAEFESYQRSQALVLIEDISARMNANRANAADYVSAGLIGAEEADCGGLSGSDLDLCEWGNLVHGNAETRGGVKVGSMLDARGCITKAPSGTDAYIVAVAWRGLNSTGAPANTCGQGDDAFGDEALRRVVSTVICVGKLSDPPAPGRC